MSGGYFDYAQARIMYKIIEPLEEWLESDKTKNFSPQVIDEFKIGLRKLKEAYIYTQRIDWLIEADDGEDTFFERLKEDYQEAGLDFEGR